MNKAKWFAILLEKGRVTLKQCLQDRWWRSKSHMKSGWEEKIMRHSSGKSLSWRPSVTCLKLLFKSKRKKPSVCKNDLSRCSSGKTGRSCICITRNLLICRKLRKRGLKNSKSRKLLTWSLKSGWRTLLSSKEKNIWERKLRRETSDWRRKKIKERKRIGECWQRLLTRTGNRQSKRSTSWRQSRIW